MFSPDEARVMGAGGRDTSEETPFQGFQGLRPPMCRPFGGDEQDGATAESSSNGNDNEFDFGRGSSRSAMYDTIQEYPLAEHSRVSCNDQPASPHVLKGRASPARSAEEHGYALPGGGYGTFSAVDLSSPTRPGAAHRTQGKIADGHQSPSAWFRTVVTRLAFGSPAQPEPAQ